MISPWVDLTQSHDTYRSKAADDPMITKAGLDLSAEAYLGGFDARDPRASPVFGDFEGLAPLLIQVGSEEALLGDSLLLAERAGHARVEVRLEGLGQKDDPRLARLRRPTEARGAPSGSRALGWMNGWAAETGLETNARQIGVKTSPMGCIGRRLSWGEKPWW